MSTSATWYKHLVIPPFTRALWVIGPTGSGKSTWAKEVGSTLDIPLLECGKWAREMAGPTASTEYITNASLTAIKKNNRLFSDKIKEELASRKESIVVGSRNPIDFVDNFVPETDAVVFLETGIRRGDTMFEGMGIKAIIAYVKFLYSTKMLERDCIGFAEPNRD